jgi:hypothetical protein
MRGWTLGIAWLLLLAGQANARQITGREGYIIGGLIATEGAALEDRFEVHLVNDAEQEIAGTIVHSQERFTFSGLERGSYYIVANIPGFKPIRQRVDFVGGQREISVPIVLEAEPVVVTKSSTDTGEGLVTDVSRLARPPAMLKEISAADKKLHEGNVGDARTRLESLVARAPDFYDAHRLLANAYQSEHRFREAEAEYRIAQKLNPTSPAPWIGLGSNYLELAGSGTRDSAPVDEIIRQARQALEQAIKLDPGIGFAHCLLGILYYKSSQYDQAEASLIRALDLDTGLGVARLGLINLYVRTRQWSRALAQIDSYIKENPRAPNRDEVLATRSQIERMTAG